MIRDGSTIAAFAARAPVESRPDGGHPGVRPPSNHDPAMQNKPNLPGRRIVLTLSLSIAYSENGLWPGQKNKPNLPASARPPLAWRSRKGLVAACLVRRRRPNRPRIAARPRQTNPIRQDAESS